MPKLLLIFSILIIGLQVNAESLLINGDLYASLDCIKIGKESTNKIYYFDELSIEEQEWFINHPDAKAMISKGKIYLNINSLHVAVTNAGYGTFAYPYNAREYDKFSKKHTEIKTFKEACMERKNKLYTPLTTGEKVNLGYMLIREVLNF